MKSTERSDEFHVHRHVSNSLLPELWLFVRSSGKWWMLPIFLVLLLLGALALVSGSVYAPLIYTLF